jgi:hypothetical protein
MIDHVWSVICEEAVIDRRSNRVSIHNAIEQITIKGEPKPDAVLQMKLDLISLWIRSNPNEPASGEMRLSFVPPSGDTGLNLVSPIKLSEHERIRNLINIETLPIHEPGRYYFIVEQRVNTDEWKRVAAIPITIIFEPLEQEEG